MNVGLNFKFIYKLMKINIFYMNLFALWSFALYNYKLQELPIYGREKSNPRLALNQDFLADRIYNCILKFSFLSNLTRSVAPHFLFVKNHHPWHSSFLYLLINYRNLYPWRRQLPFESRRWLTVFWYLSYLSTKYFRFSSEVLVGMDVTVLRYHIY